jgi:uncharacterized membrane protein
MRDPSYEINFMAAAYRRGPLPPPEELEKYEAILPGSTKMLFDNLIKQTDHRMDLEKTVIKGDDKRANLGQVLSFILGMTAIVGGVALILAGKDGYGLASIITALGALLTSFFAGAFLRKKERENKNIEKSKSHS